VRSSVCSKQITRNPVARFHSKCRKSQDKSAWGRKITHRGEFCAHADRRIHGRSPIRAENRCAPASVGTKGKRRRGDCGDGDHRSVKGYGAPSRAGPGSLGASLTSRRQAEAASKQSNHLPDAPASSRGRDRKRPPTEAACASFVPKKPRPRAGKKRSPSKCGCRGLGRKEWGGDAPGRTPILTTIPKHASEMHQLKRASPKFKRDQGAMERGQYPGSRLEHIANEEQIVYSGSTVNLSSAGGGGRTFRALRIPAIRSARNECSTSSRRRTVHG
jgi:hypothetical protein